MGQPKKQSSPRKTGLRRSHLRLELARRVNAKSPVKVRTTTKETGKALAKKATLDIATPVKAAKKPQVAIAK
jgi:ribosomal protein L32